MDVARLIRPEVLHFCHPVRLHRRVVLLSRGQLVGQLLILTDDVEQLQILCKSFLPLRICVCESMAIGAQHLLRPLVLPLMHRCLL